MGAGLSPWASSQRTGSSKGAANAIWGPALIAEGGYVMQPQRVVVLSPDDAFRARNISAMPIVVAQRSLFPDGEQLVALPNPRAICRAHVLAVATTAFDHDHRLQTLYQLIDICVAWAARVDCAVPYLAYGRQDRRIPAGSAVSAALPARIVSALGAHTMFAIDRHSNRPSVSAQAVVNIPSAQLLAERLDSMKTEAKEVIATDFGGSGRAALVAAYLGLPCRSLDKRRREDGVYYERLPPDLRGSSVIVVDDVCTTGSTLRPLLLALAAIGCEVPAVAVTHLLMAPDALAARLPGKPRLVFTDTAADHPGAVPVMPHIVEAWKGLPV
jgi:ribose-phosphate pyrophosphokinase